MSGSLLAYVANDNILEVAELRDVDDAYVNAATVQCTGVTKVAGGALAGFPITLSYVVGSNGIYRGTLQETLALEENAAYEATVTVSGGGFSAMFTVPFTAAERTTR